MTLTLGKDGETACGKITRLLQMFACLLLITLVSTVAAQSGVDYTGTQCPGIIDFSLKTGAQAALDPLVAYGVRRTI